MRSSLLKQQPMCAHASFSHLIPFTNIFKKFSNYEEKKPENSNKQAKWMKWKEINGRKKQEI